MNKNKPARTPWDAALATKKNDQVITVTVKRGRIHLEFKCWPGRLAIDTLKAAGFHWSRKKSEWIGADTYKAELTVTRLDGAIYCDATVYKKLEFAAWEETAPWNEIVKVADRKWTARPELNPDEILEATAREFYAAR